jgi:hypothetical protein
MNLPRQQFGVLLLFLLVRIAVLSRVLLLPYESHLIFSVPPFTSNLTVKEMLEVGEI